MNKYNFTMAVIILLMPISSFASSHLNTAIEFVNVYHPQTATQRNVDMVMGNLFQQNPSLASKKDKINQFLLKKLWSKEYRTGLAKIYMNEFNEKELKELIAFYKTPLGERTLVSMPKINFETMKFSQVYFNTIAEEFNQVLTQ